MDKSMRGLGAHLLLTKIGRMKENDAIFCIPEDGI